MTRLARKVSHFHSSMLSCTTLVVSSASFFTVVPSQRHLRSLQSARRPRPPMSPQSFVFSENPKGLLLLPSVRSKWCSDLSKCSEDGRGDDIGGRRHWEAEDLYIVQKLLHLRGDDGFRMNGALVPLWYIMGLWPLVYTMLILPSGRSFHSLWILQVIMHRYIVPVLMLMGVCHLFHRMKLPQGTIIYDSILPQLSSQLTLEFILHQDQLHWSLKMLSSCKAQLLWANNLLLYSDHQPASTYPHTPP